MIFYAPGICETLMLNPTRQAATWEFLFQDRPILGRRARAWPETTLNHSNQIACGKTKRVFSLSILLLEKLRLQNISLKKVPIRAPNSSQDSSHQTSGPTRWKHPLTTARSNARPPSRPQHPPTPRGAQRLRPSRKEQTTPVDQHGPPKGDGGDVPSSKNTQWF